LQFGTSKLGLNDPRDMGENAPERKPHYCKNSYKPGSNGLAQNTGASYTEGLEDADISSCTQ